MVVLGASTASQYFDRAITLTAVTSHAFQPVRGALTEQAASRVAGRSLPFE